MQSLEPKTNKDGSLSLNFTNGNVQASTENTVICGDNGSRVVELYRKSDAHFEVLRH